VRELTDTEKRQLEQHTRWLTGNGEKGARLGWSRADLRGADLCEADLSEANLYGANLRGADLREANLRGADLRRADLRGANLYGANLYGANLCEANLYGANLRGADLSGAIGIVTITPRGSRGDILKAVIHGDGWHIYTGCFGGTLADFEAAVERDHANDKWGVLYRADIAMLRATEQVFLDEIREWEVNRG